MATTKNARVHAEEISGAGVLTEWMAENAAEDLADEFGGMGCYRNIRIELRD